MVAARLPKSLVSDIKKIEDVEQTDRSTLVKEILEANFTEWRREKALEIYKQGGVSLRKASKLAGIHLLRFQKHLWERKIPLNWTPEESPKILYFT